jgi:hypothetical protein
MKHFTKLFIPVLLLIFIKLSGQNEQKDITTRLTFAPATGIFAGGKMLGLYGGIKINHYKDTRSYFLTYEFINARESALFVDPDKTVNQFDIMIGKQKELNKSVFYWQAGAGITYGRYCGKLLRNNGWVDEIYEEKHYFTYGIPLEAGIKNKNSGIGGNFRVHINGWYPVGMLGIFWEL